MSVTVAVDANGADLGPAEVAAGAAIAAEEGVAVLLFAPADEVGDVPEGVEVVDAPVSIAKAPDPVRAVRSAPEASIVQATRAVADGRAQAFVSGGSTGPALAAASSASSARRASIGRRWPSRIPVPGHPVTLLDVGANTEVRPEHLVQFGFMGAALAQVVLGVERPRVGLLSIGEEATKGTPLVVEAHAALRDRLAESELRLRGQRRGQRDHPRARRTSIVTDGFTGNVALKLMEGVSQTMLGAVRDAAMSSRARQGRRGAPARRAARLPRRDRPRGHGGAYLLGLRRLGVVPHGRFTRVGFSQAILLAGARRRGDARRAHARGARGGRRAARSPAARASSEPTSTVPTP